MKFNQLTALRARATDAGYYCDGAGLYLQVAKHGAKNGSVSISKNWVFRFNFAGRTREMGLGSAKIVSLKAARELVRECREQLVRGDDPIELRRAKRDVVRAKAATTRTFKECAEVFIATHAASWRNDKHRHQWRQTLEQYAYPVLGNLSVDAVDLPHVLKVLEPIWAGKTTTANRVRARIEKVLSWATVRKYRRGDNPARWSGHLSELLPAKGKRPQHHEALPFSEIPAFMAKLRSDNSLAARALEFTILTATRSGEARGARWGEIDLNKAL
jgi:hypothetical protein